VRNQEKRNWKLRCLRAVCLLKANGQDEGAQQLMKASMYSNWEVQRDYWMPTIELVEVVYGTAVTKENK